MVLVGADGRGNGKDDWAGRDTDQDTLFHCVQVVCMTLTSNKDERKLYKGSVRVVVVVVLSIPFF